jgi:hypothetical protein
MRGYRDLPMAPHEETVLSDAASRKVFAGFLEAEQRALDLLRGMAEQHTDMRAKS